MPTYAYAGKDCDHAFETVQSFTEDSLTECPVCHGNLRKKFNSVGVVFKGSGFYRTDSRNASNASAPAAPAKQSSGDSGSAGSASPSPATTSSSSTGEKVSTNS